MIVRDLKLGRLKEGRYLNRQTRALYELFANYKITETKSGAMLIKFCNNVWGIDRYSNGSIRCFYMVGSIGWTNKHFGIEIGG